MPLYLITETATYSVEAATRDEAETIFLASISLAPPVLTECVTDRSVYREDGTEEDE
jgi:short-subunit dehydrogenase involved in D-alanine esterification of teichoic acids